jgi:hypothetical protein
VPISPLASRGQLNQFDAAMVSAAANGCDLRIIGRLEIMLYTAQVR